MPDLEKQLLDMLRVTLSGSGLRSALAEWKRLLDSQERLPSREFSLVRTKLEEAEYWVGGGGDRAVARRRTEEALYWLRRGNA